MPTMFPTVTNAQGGNRALDTPGNESRHNKPDFNKGGGPTNRTARKVAPKSRGGFGHQGQRVHVQARMPGGRSSSGNPAKRGGTPVHINADTRNPNKGGAVQVRDMMDTVSGRGGFGHSGQQGVPGVRTNPQPGAGNTSGRMAKRIAGRFNNKSKQASGNTGSYGGPPVRLDTR